MFFLVACANEQQSACMTDEEIAAYRVETGTMLNDAALRAGCQQSDVAPGPHDTTQNFEAEAKDVEGISTGDAGHFLKALWNAGSWGPWVNIL